MMKLKLPKTENKGFVVVVVLCTIMALSVLLLGFNYQSRTSLRAVDDFRKSRQALNCARAGLNIAIAAINRAAGVRTNRTLSNALSGEKTFNIGDGDCSVTVIEENAKLNVNLLKDKSGSLNQTRVEQLLRLIDLLNEEQDGSFRISYDIAPSIIDWTDADDQTTCLPFVKQENSGAESDYYGRLNTAYRCRNASLCAAEELLPVKGITPEVFERIRDYITVYGDGKISINSAPKRIIESLSENMDSALAQMIIDRRQLRPFESLAELRDIPGMTDSIYYAIKNAATINPADRYYRVISRGNVDRLGCTIDAIVRKNIRTKNVEVILYKEL
ncbi:MAG TPA: type II secretion system protein GspK [Sedimentisphaerales bacterium]|nr:type II secretion system protein GspK [Sedimentisphaerales bacterium]